MIAAILCVSVTLAAPAPRLVQFDLASYLASLPIDGTDRYDALKFVTALQGVVNRDAPRLILRLSPDDSSMDAYWLSVLRQGWLKGWALDRVADIGTLLACFPESKRGVVVWDPAVPATANVAATACGVEGWLPVRANSGLHRRLVESGPKLPVRLSLEGMFTGSETGSRKCDAYLWAKRTYLDAGRCHPALMAYYCDAFPGGVGGQDTLPNQDYFIARRAFFFDLLPWADEAPVDDPAQPLGTDKRTLEALLQAQYRQNKGRQFTSVGGFVPWNVKYTDAAGAGGRHGAVNTEWEYAAILSAHNAILDADAVGPYSMANASAYRHHPLKKRYKQNPRPASRPLENKTYVLVYMGDYDSAAWLSNSIAAIWDDPARGSLPIAWAFNPNLADRVPYVFDHVYRTKTANDWFIAGDSGAGYLNPTLLAGERRGSGLPNALELWVKHNTKRYARFGYSITGFVIDGFAGDMPLEVQLAYAKFSPDGVGMQLGFAAPLAGGAPFIRHVGDIYPDPPRGIAAAVDQMAGAAQPSGPQFLLFRMILQTPSTLRAIRDGLCEKYPDRNWEFCDPYTFFDLYKRSIENAATPRR
ncbi:MAG TPA: GxGYxYP family putative glycoside hydrolase [Candidatus Hydrogenedentes bacterium]|nr:GxGYxYP family putative glycoside hydrolase [Candidatus Hydrogenedentota bacterium]HOS02564.1 GxGYxYP family putative glycoside hydrolase [Candidatus Hydrogenedentota bacterium]